MKTFHGFRHGLVASVLGLAALAPGSSRATFIAYIDHPSGYSTGDCQNANNDGCGDVTGSIRSGLTSLGWNVNRFYTGPSAWATDFIDCSIMSGDDCNQADLAHLAIYDGHGNTGSIGFASSHSGICDAKAVQTELGRFQGSTTALFISTACCYMHLGFPQTFTEHNGLNQQLGFGGEASMDSGMIGNYWSASGSSNNAWLGEMEDKPGWFTGDNTTVMFTRGSSLADALNSYNTCGLRRGTCWTRKGLTVGSAWEYDYYDHGASGCNAGLP